MIEVIERNNNGRNKISSLNSNILYIPVVDGKELSCVSESYDVALLLALEYKYCGINSQFVKFATRMLGIDTVWSK